MSNTSLTIQAVAFILLDADRVLVEYDAHKAGLHGCPYFIPGGRLDYLDGGDPVRALHREMAEELGVAPVNPQPLGLVDGRARGRPPFLMQPFLVPEWTYLDPQRRFIPGTVLDQPDVPLHWIPVADARQSSSAAIRAMLAQLPLEQIRIRVRAHG